MFGLSVIMLPGIILILAVVLIPFLLLIAFLGININFDQDVFSTGLLVASFFIAFGYIVFGDKLVKKRNNDS